MRSRRSSSGRSRSGTIRRSRCPIRERNCPGRTSWWPTGRTARERPTSSPITSPPSAPSGRRRAAGGKTLPPPPPGGAFESRGRRVQDDARRLPGLPGGRTGQGRLSDLRPDLDPPVQGPEGRSEGKGPRHVPEVGHERRAEEERSPSLCTDPQDGRRESGCRVETDPVQGQESLLSVLPQGSRGKRKGGACLPFFFCNKGVGKKTATTGKMKLRGNIKDLLFEKTTALFALGVLTLTLLLFGLLVRESLPAIRKIGASFATNTTWDPVLEEFGALPFLYGTVVSSFLAILIALPLGVGAAIFINEFAPVWLKTPISFLAELLAAIPSVIS